MVDPGQEYLAGKALQVKQDWAGALERYESALSISSAEPEILRRVAQCYGGLRDFKAGERAARLSLAYEPANGETWAILGILLGQQARWPEMEEAYSRAFHLSPLMPVLRWNLALWRLHQGDYRKGFDQYRWGRITGDRWQRTLQADWTGSTGGSSNTLFLWAEQGIGDTLQMLRFLPEARKRWGGRIVLEIQEPLIPLVAPLECVDLVVTQSDTGHIPCNFSEHCSLWDLPRVLGVSQVTGGSYLPRQGEPQAEGFRVGIAWQGNPNHVNDWRRSVPADHLRPLLTTGCELVSLQIGEHPDWLQPQLEGRDWQETAELVSSCDLVVSVDTGVVHLAGAMGVPVWVILPEVGDWRWGLPGPTRSCWYDSARLWWMNEPNLMMRMIGALREEMAAKTGGCNAPA